jgi:hypothetical protein
LAHADDVSKVEDNVDTIQKNTKTLLDTINKAGMEENPEKTKYILMSYYQTAGQNNDIKKAYRSFEDVAKFQY